MKSPFLLAFATFLGVALLVVGVYRVLSPTVEKVKPTPDTSSTVPSSQAVDPQNHEVVFGGNEEGVALGVLKPGQTATLTYISGKIVCNGKTGFSVPIWGVAIKDTDPGWIPLMPYANEGMWTNAVFIDTGSKRIPFKQGQTEIVLTNTTSRNENLRLRFHDAKGNYFDNYGDARFSFSIR